MGAEHPDDVLLLLWALLCHVHVPQFSCYWIQGKREKRKDTHGLLWHHPVG